MWFNNLLKKKSSHNLQIDSLDGLRGVAVLFVFLSHLSAAKLPALSFRGLGHYGVYLFFVLSSFLLTIPLLKETTNLYSGRLWLNYAIRRFFRIYPLYIIAVVVWYYRLAARYDFRIPLSDLFEKIYLHLALQLGKGVFWTIAVEFKFYFILPLFVFLFVRVYKRNLLLSALTVGAIIMLVIFFYHPKVAKDHGDTIELIPYLPIFLSGMLAALVYTKINGIVIRNNTKKLLEIVAIAAFLTVVATLPSFLFLLTGFTDPGYALLKNYLLYGVLWSIFIISYMNGYGLVNRLLSCRLLRFIGMISYSIYLWHVMIIGFVGRNIHTTTSIKILLVILITLTLSFLSYMIIERPFLKIRLKGRL